MHLSGTPRQTQPLDHGWTLGWDGAVPMPARVPGYAQHDLFDAGLLPDPFWGTNEHAWQAACDRDYTYACSFEVTADMLAMPRVDLVFDGIDTCAAIELNGHAIASVDNMYRTWRFSVKDALKPGRNTLRVVIASPIRAGAQAQQAHEHESCLGPRCKEPRVYLRKMPCSFGWDWGIKLPMSGIWKAVRLEAWGPARIATVWHETKLCGDQRARLHGWITFERTAPCPVAVHMQLRGPDGTVYDLDRQIDEHLDSVSFLFDLEQPALWWPNGMGAQPLYTLTATASVDGQVLSACERRVGVRQLELVNAPDAIGSTFHFRVNGRPFFAKGANWIPADALLSRLDARVYRRLLGAAATAHMNMLRVWGGGFYEHDVFYELCDELGLLVWQDVMFACSFCPSHRSFLYNLAAEVRDMLARLQHHACIAIWCGNNEVEQAVLWHKLAPDERREYDFLFEEYLAGVVHVADPSRTYWPSSSHAPFSNLPQRQDSGDTHYWGVWHGRQPFESYLERSDRFMTEFGFQSFPDLHTVRRYAAPEDFDLASEVMRFHQRSGEHGNQRMRETMLERYGLPAAFADQLTLSQVQQAEAVRIGVEHWRRHRTGHQCMGALYWQLNDNWPVASWSSIDYFGRWKGLHYAACRFFAPLLVSSHLRDGNLVVTLVNDTDQRRAGRLTWQLRTYAGRILRAGSIRARMPADAAQDLVQWTCADLLGDTPATACYFVAVWRDRYSTARGILHLAPLKDAALRDPGLAVAVADTTVTVSARHFAANVYLDCDDPAWQFSDNFFDLLPREQRVVQLVPVAAENTGAPPADVSAHSLWQMTRGA
jgi:beta-mannosidase